MDPACRGMQWRVSYSGTLRPKPQRPVQMSASGVKCRRLVTSRLRILNCSPASQNTPQIIDLAEMVVEMAVQVNQELLGELRYPERIFGERCLYLRVRKLPNYARDDASDVFYPCSEFGDCNSSCRELLVSHSVIWEPANYATHVFARFAMCFR